MITEAIFNVLFFVISVVISFIPSFPGNVVGGVSGLLELAFKSSFIVPWGTLLTALGVWVVFQNFQFAVGAVNWLIRKIPTVD